jgi:BioD-like phosphotransacetylase family protein
MPTFRHPNKIRNPKLEIPEMAPTNLVTPRVFIAATRQNDGKTTTSLGLMAALQKFYPRVGYIKPVGQRFVEISEQKIDEDTVLMDSVYKLNCPLVDMSPIAVEPDFTRKYIEGANNNELVTKIQSAFDRVAWEKDLVLCEGSGHAGVGAVFDLSNAQVARVLNAKVIIVSRGGIGKPIDEVTLNQALFEKEGVEIIGVIINKVLPGKLDYITEFARRGLKRKGLDLLGVLPHLPILTQPTLSSIQEDLQARLLNAGHGMQNLADHMVIGAMSVQNALQCFRPGVLAIIPGDREDILLALAAALDTGDCQGVTGIILTDGFEPGPAVQKLIQPMPFPVLLANENSYEVTSRVHDLIVKTRPDDKNKINLIRDLIAKHVDVQKILAAIR